jgi:hypothetical protein
VIQAVPGLLLGLTIDRIVYTMKKQFDLPPLATVITQTLFIILTLYVIEKYISAKYARDWQDSTGGIYFTVFFFGTQIHYFDNLSHLVRSFD